MQSDRISKLDKYCCVLIVGFNRDDITPRSVRTPNILGVPQHFDIDVDLTDK